MRELPTKAFSSIVVTELGMVTCAKEPQLAKAPSAILLMELGMVTSLDFLKEPQKNAKHKH